MPRTRNQNNPKNITQKAKRKTGNAAKGQKGGLAMQQPSEHGVSPLIGAAVGAAVGGVMGAAAAVALSDKNTREKVKEVATNLRDQAAGRIEEMASKAKESAKVAKDDIQHRLQTPGKKEETE